MSLEKKCLTFHDLRWVGDQTPLVLQEEEEEEEEEEEDWKQEQIEPLKKKKLRQH